MKKSIITTILSVLCSFVFAFGLTACDNENYNNGGTVNNGGDGTQPHTHTYSEEWSHDNTYHWHAATCEHTEEIKDKAEHNFINDVCSVCDYILESLEYALNSDEQSYTIIGIGTCKDTDIVIPSIYNDLPVTGIGDNAFYNCGSLTSIKILDNVASIGDNAFNGCSNLTNIVIPDNTSIGDNAFNGCPIETVTMPTSAIDAIPKTNLKSVVITSGESIEGNAFDGCTSLTSITIPDSVTLIGENAFNGCNRIETAIMPTSAISAIPQTNLKSVVITSGESIEENAFDGCTSLTSIIIPDSVTSIGKSAFEGCNSLSCITLPFIGANKDETRNTFFGYNFGADDYRQNDRYVPESLKTVVITSAESIDFSTFYGCSSLTSITIPDSVTSIGSSAFNSCSSLTSIVIPDSVTSIGIGAFNSCSSLTSIVIPDSVTSIGGEAFSGCSSLESITVASGNSVYHSDGNCLIETASKTLIVGCKNSVIPTDGSVTSIRLAAFEGCSSLTSITIPDGVTHIGERAFAYCSSLTSITIPDSVTSIGGATFLRCGSLICNEYSNGYYLGNPNNPYLILLKAKDTSITTCTINNTTKFIHSFAFGNCRSLTSITIPDSVTSIGYGAFAYCSSLTSIAIPDSVTSIEDLMFQDCTNLTSVTIPDSVTNIHYAPFQDCSNLTSIKFNGTMQQWEAIDKTIHWDSYSHINKVICTNGILNLN